MGLVVKGTAQMVEGTYAAVCSGVIDIGTQLNEVYGKKRDEVLIIWTLPDELIEVEGEMFPRQVNNTYSATISGASKLRALLEGWRGKRFTEEELKGFDLRNILGTCCLVTVKRCVSKAGKEYTSVESASRLPKGVQLAKVNVEPILYCIEDDWAFEELQRLPEWIQNRVKASEQYKAFVNGGEVPEEDPNFGAPMPWDE